MDMLERSPRFKLAGSLALCGLLIVSPLLAVFRSIRASEAAVMTGQCHVLSSLSSAVLAFLAYLFFTWLVREHVLPACCARALAALEDADARDAWRAKIVALLLPMCVRGLCIGNLHGSRRPE